MFHSMFVFHDVMKTHCPWVCSSIPGEEYMFLISIYQHIYPDLAELTRRAVEETCNRLLKGEMRAACDARAEEIIACILHAVKVEGCEDATHRRKGMSE